MAMVSAGNYSLKGLAKRPILELPMEEKYSDPVFESSCAVRYIIHNNEYSFYMYFPGISKLLPAIIICNFGIEKLCVFNSVIFRQCFTWAYQQHVQEVV
jgi:hypothetical protein